MTPKEVIELAKKHDVKFVDMKFIDFPGVWQHTTIPANRLEEGLFEDGLAFDGSSWWTSHREGDEIVSFSI